MLLDVFIRGIGQAYLTLHMANFNQQKLLKK